jgi:dTDP-glucose pyrophosphorylase
MVNIVIPMAGRGKRFTEAGYACPKPFIDVNGKPMIIRVVENLKISDTCCFIFICLQEFIDKFGSTFEKMIRDCIGNNFKIVIVNQVTEGAACTVLLTEKYINNDDELVIANCDQLVLDNDFNQKSIDYYRKHKVDGGILCFLNDSPKWSYVKLSNSKIVEVVEKQVVSNLATVGIYYFSKGKTFVDCAKSMILNNMRVNGEFYVAPVFNGMIIRGLSVLPFLVNEMVGLGVPEDLERYENGDYI